MNDQEQVTEKEVGAYIATRVVEQTEFYVKKDFV